MVAADEVFAALRDCELLEPEQLAELEAQPGTLPAEPAALCEELVRRRWLTRYQAEQLLRGHGKELTLGGYRILAPLGEGGMGQVFKAEQRRLGRIVAIKVVHQEYLANRPEAIRRFHREARVAAQLSHPNAIRIYDADEAGSRHFIVMEHVEGLDLARLVETGGPLPVAVACDYIAQAALGLQHAHEEGLIHRDIKPSNLFVCRPPGAGRRTSGIRKLATLAAQAREDGADTVSLTHELRHGGVVKILDLGLARATERVEGESALTVEGNVMGTPDYIAPEQARNPHGVDGRADLYSLGCTFYFALAGRAPFPPSSAMEKLLMHQSDDPLPIEAVRPKTPESVGNVIRKLMAKSPAHRYQTAQELHDDLARLAPTLAPPSAESLLLAPGAPESPTPFFDELRLQTAAPPTPRLDHVSLSNLKPLSGSLAELAEPGADGAVPGSFGNECSPAEQWGTLDRLLPPEGGASKLSLELDWGAEAPSTVDTPVLGSNTLDGYTALPTVRAGAGAEQLQSVNLNWTAPPAADGDRPPEARAVAAFEGHAGCVVALAFSRDRELLASGGVDGTVRLWKLDPDDYRQDSMLQAQGGEVRSLAFAHDSRRIAFGTSGGQTWIWELGDPPAGVPTIRELTLPGRPPFGAAQRHTGSRSEHYPAILALAFSLDDRLAAVGSGKAIHLFQVGQGEARHWVELSGHAGDVTELEFAPDGKVVASVGRDDTVRVWDPSRYFRKLQLNMKVADASCLAYSPDGTALAISSGAHSHQVWGLASDPAQRLARFENHRGAVRILQFQKDGSRLLAVDEQGCVCLRDLEAGARLSEWSVPFTKAYSFAVSADGRYLAAGNIDGRIILYRIAP